MRKIINDPVDFVDEVIDGLLCAHGEELRSVGSDNRALVRADAGRPGRVGIVTGGGSGHLPLFLGYVGVGLASGVAVGNVFSSPSAAQIHAATLASDGGEGVLYLYGNYGGDVYNFDLAADLAAADGIRTTTVVGIDDVMSAPPGRAHERRGVAGLVLAYKVAGAAAERGDDLENVTRLAQRVVEGTRTMGVGLAPTILPAAGEPTFTLAEGEMEVGIGIHGEPGHHRGALEAADDITDRLLTEILAELDLVSGRRVVVLVNGLGATPLEELYLIYRRVHHRLTDLGVGVHRRYIGEFVTSLEMAGASVSILELDAELAELIDAPASSPFFRQGAPAIPPSLPETRRSADISAAAPGPARPVRRADRPGPLRTVMIETARRMPAHADELRELDAALGDGDLGITVTAGSRAVVAALEGLPSDAHPSELLRAAGAAFAAANPSTFGALLGGGLLAAATAYADREDVSPETIGAALTLVQRRIMDRGGAEVGDKTVVDVLDAVSRELARTDVPMQSGELSARLTAAAGRAVSDGAKLASRRGRAGWIAERTVGHRDPGSVAFLRLLEEIGHLLRVDERSVS